MSLNPCCNGRWSSTKYPAIKLSNGAWVLILVVMEDGLVLCVEHNVIQRKCVLILVVMEDGLVQAI